MKSSEFKSMWNDMQVDGYFEKSDYYTDFHDPLARRPDEPMDIALKKLDFSQESLHFPLPHSADLEKSVVHTESHWLPRMFDLPTSGLAIDIGCGYGRSVSWLKDRFDRVIGVDISEHIIEKAASVFSAFANVSFLVSEADRLPEQIGDGTADFIYAFTVFQHIPREYTAGYVREAFRKLKPGGLLAFNLLSDAFEDLNDGDYGSEWRIGYSRDAAVRLVTDAGLSIDRIVRWSAEGAPASWLWVSARKPAQGSGAR